MKKLLFVASVFLLVTSSCKKEDMSKYATKDDLNNYATNSSVNSAVANNGAKTFNFDLTFNPGDTWKTYTGITGYDSGDVVIVFTLYAAYGTIPYWVQTPFVYSNAANIFAEFSETNGHLYINTERADGLAGSPWASGATIAFKAVLIKSSGLKQNPNVDLTSYKAVQEAFNLVD